MKSEEQRGLLTARAEDGDESDFGGIPPTVLSTLPFSQDPFSPFGDVIRDYRAVEVDFDPNSRTRYFDTASRSLPARKRVLPESAFGWTPNLVVVAQQKLPDYLFTDMCLVNEKGGVVEEFEYHKEGYKRQGESGPYRMVEESDCGGNDEPILPEILYDIDREDEDWTGYVRVITKSSYYMDLSKELVKAMMVGVSEYSHFSFYAVLVKHPTQEIEIRLGFLFLLLGFLLLRLLVALRSACVEWDADGRAGPDLLRQAMYRSPDGMKERPRDVSCYTRMRIFASMVLFAFLGVRSIVKDLPIWLHPWKGVQPYAAFKADKARGFLLGFPDEFLFRVEDKPGMLPMYALIALTTIAVTAAKLMFYFQLEHHTLTDDKETLLFLFLNVTPGCFVMYSNVMGFFWLARDRHRGYKWLARKWNEGDAKQKRVMDKLIKKHYKRSPCVGPDESSPDQKQSENGFSKSISLSGDDQRPAPNADYSRKKHCAELVRQLQLWDAPLAFCDELKDLPEKDRVTSQEAERVLRALRLVAEAGQCSGQYCRRGPRLRRSDLHDLECNV